MPLTVAPAAGLVSATVGGVVSDVERTVTCRVDDVEELPLTSTARAESVTFCPPYDAVFHAIQYGLVVSVAMTVPLARNSTRATPVASVAFAATCTIPLTVVPAVGIVSETEGAVVSVDVEPAESTSVNSSGCTQLLNRTIEISAREHMISCRNGHVHV